MDAVEKLKADMGTGVVIIREDLENIFNFKLIVYTHRVPVCTWEKCTFVYVCSAED